MIKVSIVSVSRVVAAVSRLAHLFVELVMIHFIFCKPFSKLQPKIKKKNKNKIKQKCIKIK